MRWDMSFLYPGLAMRVAPSISHGGILEFVMDPNQEALNIHRVKEIGTGKDFFIKHTWFICLLVACIIAFLLKWKKKCLEAIKKLPLPQEIRDILATTY